MQDEPLLYYFRLAKAGYGSVKEIEEWDARKILQALAYEGFCQDYESAYLEMNRGND